MHQAPTDLREGLGAPEPARIAVDVESASSATAIVPPSSTDIFALSNPLGIRQLRIRQLRAATGVVDPPSIDCNDSLFSYHVRLIFGVEDWCIARSGECR